MNKDTLHHIGEYLSARDIARIRRTSRDFERLSKPFLYLNFDTEHEILPLLSMTEFDTPIIVNDDYLAYMMFLNIELSDNALYQMIVNAAPSQYENLLHLTRAFGKPYMIQYFPLAEFPRALWEDSSIDLLGLPFTSSINSDHLYLFLAYSILLRRNDLTNLLSRRADYTPNVLAKAYDYLKQLN